jgi:hypothetical protein
MGHRAGAVTAHQELRPIDRLLLDLYFISRKTKALWVMERGSAEADND